jgi:hypothetical protein
MNVRGGGAGRRGRLNTTLPKAKKIIQVSSSKNCCVYA